MLVCIMMCVDGATAPSEVTPLQVSIPVCVSECVCMKTRN